MRLCLDDFGTGYSSLTYLSRLPIDVVKIDRSFVTALGHLQRDSSVVATIIGMARTLGHGSSPRGSRPVDQLGQLAALGCEMAQGYLFAEARPATDVDLAARVLTRNARVRPSPIGHDGSDAPTRCAAGGRKDLACSSAWSDSVGWGRTWFDASCVTGTPAWCST